MKTPEQVAEQAVRQYISAPFAREDMTPRQLIAGLGLSNMQAASIFGMIADAIEADRAQRSEPVEYREGDPDPTPDRSPFCGRWRDGLVCTWHPGHDGPHVAGDGTTVAAVWS